MATISTIADTHPDYQKAAPQWKRMRDTTAGQDAIKAAKTLYLPPLNADDVVVTGNVTKISHDYQIYLDNAEFYNAVGLTFNAFIGMIFRKPTQIGEGEDDAVKDNDLLTNVDLEGTDIENFTMDITEEVAKIGRVGILYDFPTVRDMEEISVAAAAEQGQRAYLKQYNAENITNWKFKNINGVRKLIAVILKEEIDADPDNHFTHDMKVQYRALLIEDGFYVQRVYDEGGNENEALANEDIQFNGVRLNFIPLTVINASSIGLDIEKPPLLDLADTNLTHYKASASLGACIHMFGRITPIYYVPAQHWKEFVKTPKHYGVTKDITIPTTGDGAKAEAGFLEPTSDFTPIVNQMERLEVRMAAQGARALRPQKSGVESGETVGLDMMAELSTLGAIANNVSIGLSMAVTWLLGGNADDMTQVKLNTDFLTTPIDAAMVAQLLKAVQDGNMSQEQFVDAMIRGEAYLPEAEITTDTEFTEKEVEETPREAMEVALLGQELSTPGGLNSGADEE